MDDENLECDQFVIEICQYIRVMTYDSDEKLRNFMVLAYFPCPHLKQITKTIMVKQVHSTLVYFLPNFCLKKFWVWPYKWSSNEICNMHVNNLNEIRKTTHLVKLVLIKDEFKYL